MRLQTATGQRSLPTGLRDKLVQFRRRVWTLKTFEVALAATFVLILSYLLVFGLDRLVDTPAWVRAAFLGVGVAGFLVLVPIQAYRWVWRVRQFDEVSRLVARKDRRAGDGLLGIVELTRNEKEFGRSPALCEAAVHQVDESLRERDLSDALPDSAHVSWSRALVVPVLLGAALFVVAADASRNALARWGAPWGDTARYTFAQTSALPGDLVVAKAEPFHVRVALSDETVWSPGTATVRYGNQERISATLTDGAYEFRIPPQTVGADLRVSVGDFRTTLAVKPLDRPKIASIQARVQLPAYLDIPAPRVRDVRGGSVSIVRGGEVSFTATLTRELAAATCDGDELATDGPHLTVPARLVEEKCTSSIEWTDREGLAGREPFELTVFAVADESPNIACVGLKREMVVLDAETLSFDVHTSDDYGVREVGLTWQGVHDPLENPKPSSGEKVLASGSGEMPALDALATFSAKRLGVPAQTLTLRAYVTDALPGRERTYSPEYTIYVLTPEEHMIWLTHQLGQWFQEAVEVRDRELELHQKNKELRELSAEELAEGENRRKLENQALAERANGRRLDRLSDLGEKLVEQAARNPEFNTQTMDEWAEMIRTLKEIAENRMPSVAELLAKAARSLADADSGKKPEMTGEVRDGGKGGPPSQSPPSEVPSIADVESSFNDPAEGGGKPQESRTKPRMTLAQTTVQGGGAKQDDEDPEEDDAPSPSPELDEAIEEQAELLAEFNKVAGEIARVLRNLEGSTFVKRLKSLSRQQTRVAKDLGSTVERAFGVGADELEQATGELYEEVALREVAGSRKVSLVQSDLAAYANRVDEEKFKTVLDEMKDMSPSGELQQIARTVEERRSGDSIARAEFLADTFDRWAEQLVGPG